MNTVLLYVVGVLIFALGIIVSIGLHEIGHMIPAKRFGVKVTKYMIGMGPTLFSFRRGDTEYGLKAIPLMGYVSMIGMFPPAKPGGRARTASTGFFQSLVQDARSANADTIGPGDDSRTFYRLAVWKRIVVMLGGPVMNLIIGTVLFAILLCGFGTQQYTTTLGDVSPCIVASGSTSATCAPDAPASPAKTAGLRNGDTIESIDGVAMTSWNQTATTIQKAAGKTLDVVVERDGRRTTLQVTPVASKEPVTNASGNVETTPSGATKTHVVGVVGIAPTVAQVRQPITAVLPAVGAQTAAVAGVIVHLPQRMVAIWQAAFGSGQRQANGPVSIVGVGRAAGELTSSSQISASGKIFDLLSLLASVNIALFVFNLIPLLPLDGGHIAGALWEGLKKIFARVFRRRAPHPVDTAKLMPLTFGVVIVLGAMSLLLIYADIVKPVNFLG